MSAQDIIAELPKLSRPELEQVDSRLHELLRGGKKSSSKHWGEALAELSGTASGLPSDYAAQHDHYLHGKPRR